MAAERRSLRFHIWRASLVILLPYLLLGWATSRIERDPMSREIPADLRLPGSVIERGTPVEGAENSSLLPGLPTEVRGVLSVHSGRSHDAEGTLEEVAAAALAEGLDFVVLGEHPTAWIEEPGVFDPLRIDGVHLSRGAELVVSESGRTLTLGYTEVPRLWSEGLPRLREVVDSAGGFVSIVHARSPRYRESWKAPSVEGAHAFEAFDVSEMARLRLASVWGPYHLLSFLVGTVADRSDESVLRLWRERSNTPALLAYDSLRATNRIALTGGLNHHSKTRTPFGLFPGFRPMFRTVVNHLHLESALPADPSAAQREVAAAIREGRLYISLGWPEEAGGFHFVARTPELHPAGSILPPGPETRLLAHLPATASGRFVVELRRDGQVVDRRVAGGGAVLRWNPERPGVYRVEVHRAGIDLGPLRLGRAPWLFSNPIELTAP